MRLFYESKILEAGPDLTGLTDNAETPEVDKTASRVITALRTAKEAELAAKKARQLGKEQEAAELEAIAAQLTSWANNETNSQTKQDATNQNEPNSESAADDEGESKEADNSIWSDNAEDTDDEVESADEEDDSQSSSTTNKESEDSTSKENKNNSAKSTSTDSQNQSDDEQTSSSEQSSDSEQSPSNEPDTDTSQSDSSSSSSTEQLKNPFDAVSKNMQASSDTPQDHEVRERDFKDREELMKSMRAVLARLGRHEASGAKAALNDLLRGYKADEN